VDRRYLFKPKDEEPPPEGSGENWFEHNYRPRPIAQSIRLQINPRALADVLNPFIEQSNMTQVVKICQEAKIEVVTTPGSPIVELRLLP
jgi:hypothetical protein